MAVTDTQLRNAKGQTKPRKIADGGGLFILINPDDSLAVAFDRCIAARTACVVVALP